MKPSQCAAVGDSRSDLPLFAEVGLAIAFNATAATRASAHEAVHGLDLRAVVPLLATWLGRIPVEGVEAYVLVVLSAGVPERPRRPSTIACERN